MSPWRLCDEHISVTPEPAELTIAVVIPAYNVGGHLARVIKGVPAWVRYVIVVDDCSTDDAVATAIGTRDPRLHLVPRSINGGVGAATKEGYRYALGLGANVIVKMDGDDRWTQHDCPRWSHPSFAATPTIPREIASETAFRSNPCPRCGA